jgi:sugar O-acyltransferase (sialic acid O-acetyltransferase NeuD family)
MSTKAIIIFGFGGHAESCIDVIQSDGNYEIAGIVGSRGEVGQEKLGLSVIAVDSEISKLRKKFDYAFIALGQIKTCIPRAKLFNQLKNAGFILPQIISPLSYVSKHAKVGEGTIVMHGAIVNANAVIGKNCIINSMSLVEHGVSVGDNCHISTGAILNGNVKVGSGSFLGSGVRIRQEVEIGDDSFIPMGSVVIKNRV